MARKPAVEPQDGFRGRPADAGLSIDRLAQAFAAMMGTGDPYADESPASVDVAKVDTSPDLDADTHDEDRDEAEAACRVTPATILEAMLFVGLSDGEPLCSRRVAGLMRGVRPQEIDDLAVELRDRYDRQRRPYEVISAGAGWILRLREEYRQFGRILEQRARQVRLDEESLDTLAVVAWNQPVRRDRLVQLGCDARPGTLRQLVRRGLLRLLTTENGEEPSYETTDRFLEVFKLRQLSDLPKPDAPPA
jgi:segregation and condensation protein B